MQASAEEPVLRVVRGTPSAEEIAALVGVLGGLRRPTAGAPAAAPSRWAASARPGWRPRSWRG